MKTNLPLSDGDIEVKRSWPRRLIDASFSIGYIPVTWNGNSYSFREYVKKSMGFIWVLLHCRYILLHEILQLSH